MRTRGLYCPPEQESTGASKEDPETEVQITERAPAAAPRARNGDIRASTQLARGRRFIMEWPADGEKCPYDAAPDAVHLTRGSDERIWKSRGGACADAGHTRAARPTRRWGNAERPLERLCRARHCISHSTGTRCVLYARANIVGLVYFFRHCLTRLTRAVRGTLLFL